MKATKVNYNGLMLTPDTKYDSMTVSQLRDYLDELIKAGYGNWNLSATTQDGASYNINGTLMAYNKIKELEFN
jgi:hypothetical protein